MPIEEMQQVHPTNLKIMQSQPAIQELQEKKSKWWLWVLLIVIAVIVAVGVYFWIA